MAEALPDEFSKEREALIQQLSELVTTQQATLLPMLVELRGLSKEDEQRAWFLKYVVANNRSATPQHPPFYAGPETTRSAWALNRWYTGPDPLESTARTWVLQRSFLLGAVVFAAQFALGTILGALLARAAR